MGEGIWRSIWGYWQLRPGDEQRQLHHHWMHIAHIRMVQELETSGWPRPLQVLSGKPNSVGWTTIGRIQFIQRLMMATSGR
jgi:hypothetical protein